MELVYLSIVLTAVFLIGLASQPLRRAAASAPLICIAAGWAAYQVGNGQFGLNADASHAGGLAEAALALLLFLNASQVRLGRLAKDHPAALRQALFSAPQQMLLGLTAAIIFFPSFNIWSALLLTAVLLSYDMAPWRRTLAEKHAPLSIRRTLCVDGVLTSAVAAPIVIVIAVCASIPMDAARDAYALEMTLLSLFLGVLIGATTGWAGTRILRLLRGDAVRLIAGVGIGAAVYAIAPLAEANGVIAAMTAGFAIAEGRRGEAAALRRWRASFERRLTPLAFIGFGAFIAPRILPHMDVVFAFFALLMVTAIRFLPRYIALEGRGFHGESRFILSGFGGHGAVAILLLIWLASQPMLLNQEVLLTAAASTIGLSVILMRLASRPLAARYGRRIARLRSKGECRAEFAGR